MTEEEKKTKSYMLIEISFHFNADQQYLTRKCNEWCEQKTSAKILERKYAGGFDYTFNRNGTIAKSGRKNKRKYKDLY